uniref:Ankyrin repeat and sterile alpha motif domain-containing protein 1B n=1 Tax=Anisakis simplex TaxID=6269 RepID=A0A0M3JS75_ANISI
LNLSIVKEMLSKLVNKFKKHSLQENDLNNIQPQQNTDLYYRSTTTLNSFYSDNNSTLHDSGTESDDDELERLDCMSTREHTSDLTGKSPPNLTSSPPLLSDIESNSWDSTGCESGIVMGDREESSRDVAIESVFEVEPEGVSMHYNTAGGLYSSTSKSKQTGAFRPVTTTLHHSTQMVISGVGAQEFVESTIIDNDADTEKRRVGSL